MATSKVFVDAAAWIAILNTRDALHLAAERTMETVRRSRTPLVTSRFVLIEVANALSAPAFRKKTIIFLNGLAKLPNLQIVQPSQELYNEGWILYSQRLDKEWSLTDCTSFVIMDRERINHAFTSDHHFEQAGFIKLL
jgi:predicted nucleic acid-binding protein